MATEAGAFRVGERVRLTKAHPAHRALKMGAEGVIGRALGYWALYDVGFPAQEHGIVCHGRYLERAPDGPEAA